MDPKSRYTEDPAGWVEEVGREARTRGCQSLQKHLVNFWENKIKIYILTYIFIVFSLRFINI
jgi:hypothetical protein